MMPMHYNVTDVHARMVQAVSTLKRLPQHVLRGYISSWPEIAFERTEHGRGPGKIKIPPKAREIAEMDEAIRWLAWVPVLDRQVIWDMADAPPTPVFVIARQNGLSEAEVVWPGSTALACLKPSAMPPQPAKRSTTIGRRRL